MNENAPQGMTADERILWKVRARIQNPEKVRNQTGEAHLPTMTDEARRQKAPTYLRGLKVLLATRSEARSSAEVI